MIQRFIWQWDVNRIPKWPQKTDHNLILVVQIWSFEGSNHSETPNQQIRITEFRRVSQNCFQFFFLNFPLKVLTRAPLEGHRTLSTAFVVSSSKAMLVFQVFVVRGFNPFLDVPKNWSSCMKNLHWGQLNLYFQVSWWKKWGKTFEILDKKKQLPQNLNRTTDKKVEMENLIWVIKSPHVRNQASGHQAHLNRSKP